MKFDLSKIKYSGWVYFSSIIALPLVTSCCYADLIGTELKTDDDIKYFRCILNAKIIVANTIRDIHKVYQCDEWIKRAEYKDSIYNVIPTAIADCALGREEFAKEKINDGIVTFDNKDYEHYTAENWNALVLYNFINYLWPKTGTAESGNLYWWDHAGYFYKEIIQSGRLSNACGDNYANEINDAYKDIVEYNKQLCLWELLYSIHCVSDENLRRQVRQRKLDDVVYDVGKGEQRRIRYNFSRTTFASAGSEVYEPKYLTIEIANEKLDRILAYSKAGVDAIELNDYMEITKTKKVYDPDNDDGKATIDLSKQLTDIDPALLVVWHENDEGIHISKIKYDMRLEDIIHKANFKRARTIKLTAYDKYKARLDSNKEQIKQKKIIFGRECFSRITNHKGSVFCKIDIELCGINGGVILPTDCPYLFSYSPAIRNIRISGFTTEAETLERLCNESHNLEQLYIHIRHAPNLKNISSMVVDNDKLKAAKIYIQDAPLINDLSVVFAGCKALETVKLGIKTPKDATNINMDGLFYGTEHLKSIIFQDENWIKLISIYPDYEYRIFGCHNGICWTLKGINKAHRITEQINAPIILNHLIIDEDLYDALKKRKAYKSPIDELDIELRRQNELLKLANEATTNNTMQDKIDNIEAKINNLEFKRDVYTKIYITADKQVKDAYKQGYICK